MDRHSLLDRLSTEDEFTLAIELLGRCTSSVNCGCDLSGCELDVLVLRYKAKEYINAVEDMP